MTTTSVNPDAVILAKHTVLGECFEDIDARAQKQEDDCKAYADHLWQGGDPTVVSAWVGGTRPFTDAGGYWQKIERAWRKANGMRMNPYSPASAFSYRMCDVLLKNYGEFVTVNDLRSAVADRFSKPQVQNILRDHVLHKEGYELEKGKVGTATAYRLVDYTEGS